MSERSEAQERSARNKSANNRGPLLPEDFLRWSLLVGFWTSVIMLYWSLSVAYSVSVIFVRSKNKREFMAVL
jgi:hypothetical protein